MLDDSQKVVESSAKRLIVEAPAGLENYHNGIASK